MNYTKAKVEVVNFNNDDVITASNDGHRLCANQQAYDWGCADIFGNTWKPHYCAGLPFNPA